MSAGMDWLRQRHQEYLDRLELVTGWTLSRIAREAGIRPTTLTRYRNDPAHKYELSSRTIQKLENRYGFGPGQMPPRVRIPAGGAAVAETMAEWKPPAATELTMPILSVKPLRWAAEEAIEDGIEALRISFSPAFGWTNPPPQLSKSRGVYALRVEGDSMRPRYEPGNLIAIDPSRPPAEAEDALVLLTGGDEEVGTGLLKRLAAIRPDGVELEEFYPQPRRFFVPSARIQAIHRVAMILLA